MGGRESTASCISNHGKLALSDTVIEDTNKNSSSNRGGDVAQLEEHRTGMLPTHVRFPVAARDFS